MLDILRVVTKVSTEVYATVDRAKWCCERPGQVVLATALTQRNSINNFQEL